MTWHNFKLNVQLACLLALYFNLFFCLCFVYFFWRVCTFFFFAFSFGCLRQLVYLVISCIKHTFCFILFSWFFSFLSSRFLCSTILSRGAYRNNSASSQGCRNNGLLFLLNSEECSPFFYRWIPAHYSGKHPLKNFSK